MNQHERSSFDPEVMAASLKAIKRRNDRGLESFSFCFTKGPTEPDGSAHLPLFSYYPNGRPNAESGVIGQALEYPLFGLVLDGISSVMYGDGFVEFNSVHEGSVLKLVLYDDGSFDLSGLPKPIRS